MWKNWFKTTILVTSIGLLSACGSYGRSPGDTVEKFYDEIKNGEINEAIDLTGDNIVDRFGKSKLKALFSEQVDRYQGAEIEIKEEEINGEVATVTYKVKLEDRTEENQEQKLVKEDGEWVMSPELHKLN
jgi:hypothetical protein